MPDPDFQRFAREGCPEAFRRLVERHLDMAHSTARRVLGPRADLAEDVSQQVFLLLVRKASTLPEGIAVGAWLHRQTVRRALNTVRSETRRERRELQFEEDAAALAAGEENGKWPELAVQLDQALLRLPETDRQAVILRFMHRMPPEKLASSLGVSAAAALRRASRALESLRLILRRRGVEIPAAATLGTLLTRESAQAAPAWVAEQIITQAPAALAASGSAAAASGNLTAFLVMTHAKAPALALVLVAVLSAGGGWWAAGDTPAASVNGSAEASASPAVHSPEPTVAGSTWLERIGMARPEDFVALAEEAKRESNAAVREERLGNVFSRWVEVDPQAGWAWANAAFPGKRESSSRPPDTRLAFLLHWTAVDGPSAYAAERGAPRRAGVLWELEIALKWSRIDARGLLDFVESGKWDKGSRSGATVYALRALAREEPLAVYEMCLELERDDRNSVISVVAESLGAKDPEAALEWARRLPSEGEGRELAYYGIFGALSQSQPARAAELMEKALPEDLKDAKERVADPLLQRWMSVDPAEATRWALRQGPDYAGRLWWLIPPGTPEAFDIRQSLSSDEERSQWDSRQSGNWTAAAAGEWLERHTSPSTEMETATARTGVMALAREDVSAAARWVDQLPEGPLRNDLRNVLLAGMAETGANPSLIMDQLARLTEVPDDDAPRQMVARLAAERPAEILEKISALPAGGGKRDTWLAETAAAWAETDPSAASSWTDTIPSTETRAVILGQVLDGWWPEDPEAAEAWAATQPAGILRDTAAARIAEGLTREAPDEAFNWALGIGDGTLRAERLAPAYRDWAAMDPEDAAAALAESALTDAEKTHITDFAAQHGRGPFQD